MSQVITVTPVRPYLLRAQLAWAHDCKAPTGIIVDTLMLSFFSAEGWVIPQPFYKSTWPQLLVPVSPEHSLSKEIGKEQQDWLEYRINPKQALASFRGFLPQDAEGAVDEEVLVRVPLQAILATLGPDGTPYALVWEDYYAPKEHKAALRPSLSLVQ
jgi:hypothetical protein